MTRAVLAAIERIDTWVLAVSIAVPLVCVAALLLWHLAAGLAGKRGVRRKAARLAPEPPAPPSAPPPTDAQVDSARRARELLALARDDFRNQRLAGCLERCQALAATFPDLPESAEARQLASQIKNDPDRLQRGCAALVESLAVLYAELAECWSRQGQPRQAAAVWQQLVRCCPETPQAQLARDRLRQSEDGRGSEDDANGTVP
jgi:hypothetical protein